jgi:hypothetical protein
MSTSISDAPEMPREDQLSFLSMSSHSFCLMWLCPTARRPLALENDRERTDWMRGDCSAQLPGERGRTETTQSPGIVYEVVLRLPSHRSWFASPTGRDGRGAIEGCVGKTPYAEIHARGIDNVSGVRSSHPDVTSWVLLRFRLTQQSHDILYSGGE